MAMLRYVLALRVGVGQMLRARSCWWREMQGAIFDLVHQQLFFDDDLSGLFMFIHLDLPTQVVLNNAGMLLYAIMLS